ncbi:MAG: hypothetical protein WCK18_08545 [Prolixibacteraceae bacterium]
MTPKRNEITPIDIAKLLGVEGEYREALFVQQLKDNYEEVMGKVFYQINNQTTKTMGPYYKELNYGFEFYHENGTLIDKIEGPGDIGNWLTVPDRDAPMFGAIIPVAYKLAEEKISKDRYIKAVRIPLDEEGNDILEAKEEAILLYADNLDDAKQVARSFGCDFMYWTEWDGSRSILIVSVAEDIDVYKDPSTETYYTYD